jgi:hypothetical protein
VVNGKAWKAFAPSRLVERAGYFSELSVVFALAEHSGTRNDYESGIKQNA